MTMVDVASTTQGGRKIAVTLSQTPCYVGFNTDATPPNVAVDWDFIDWPFLTERDFSHRWTHRKYVEAHEPAIAVAPDITEGLNPQSVIDEADKLLDHADDVVVIPKTPEFGPADVPDRFRVGVPVKMGVPSFYSKESYRQADSVHLLGSTPRAQLAWVAEEMDNVRSVDTANMIRSSQFGRLYVGNGRFEDMGDLPFGFYGYVLLNYRLYAAEWGMGGSPVDIGSRSTQSLLRMALLNEDEVREIAASLYPDAADFDTAGDGALIISVPARASGGAAADDLIRVLGDAGLQLDVEATRGATIVRVEGPKDPLGQSTLDEMG